MSEFGSDDDADRTAARDHFSSFGLPTPILRAIRAMGYQKPTAIQQESIPALLAGRDVTGVAQTGTGKTAAYGLPLLAAIDPAVHRVQALVLVPTRELAIQVTDALAAFAAQLPGLAVTAIYGGAPMHRQISALKAGTQVVVGTPGRVIDLIERKSLRLDTVGFAVLDEADEMLRMGFAEDVDRILTEVPADRQTALFSATMPKEIRRVAATHLRAPVDVSVAASATPVSTIEQQYIVLPFRDKTVALQRVIAVSDTEATVVFVRTRSACDELGSALIAAGVKAAFISGDVSQNERERTVERLRSGQLDVLVATDVAARGMDVERIGLVVNFDAPADPETYIHRVGRTGRAGRSGRAVTFFTPKETSRLRFIERTIGRTLEEIDVPTAADVHQQRATMTLGAAARRHAGGNLARYREALYAAAATTGLPADELAAALLANLIGDDGSAPVEIASARKRFEARGAERDRGPRGERYGARGDSYSPRGDKYGARSERPSRAGEDRGRSDRVNGRPSDRPARFEPRASDRTKPRWDQARREERAAERGPAHPRDLGRSARGAGRRPSRSFS